MWKIFFPGMPGTLKLNLNDIFGYPENIKKLNLCHFGQFFCSLEGDPIGNTAQIVVIVAFRVSILKILSGKSTKPPWLGEKKVILAKFSIF